MLKNVQKLYIILIKVWLSIVGPSAIISAYTLMKSGVRISSTTYFYFQFITRLIANMGYGFAESTDDGQKPAPVNYQDPFRFTFSEN